MTKLYFIFVLVAVTRADHSSVGANDGSSAHLAGSQGYSGSSSQAQDLRNSNEQSSHSSQSANSNLNQASSYRTASTSSYTGLGSSADYSGTASKTGSTGTGGYTQTQTYTGSSSQAGSAGNERDHNGLSVNDVHNLAAQGNRRRFPGFRYYSSPNRVGKVAPKRYGVFVPPKYHPVFGRSDNGAALNYASNYGLSPANTRSSNPAGATPVYSSNDNFANRQAQQESSANSNQENNNALAQQSRGANSDSAASDQSNNQNAAQESESTRRFYLQDPYSPFVVSPYDNLDPFNEFNPDNYYNAALGQFGKYLN